MNIWQVLRQMEYDAQNAQWTGTSNNLFGTVSLITSVPDEDLLSMQLPALLVRETGWTPHKEHPRLGHLSVEFSAVVENLGDRWGRSAVMGASRTANTSEGAGLAQLHTELWSTWNRDGRPDGFVIQQIRETTQGPQPSAMEGRTLAYQTYQLRVLMHDEATYPQSQAFAAVDAGGGDGTLTFTNPATRFDRVGVHIRRSAGATAPATTAAGTLVYEGSTSPQTDSPGAGQFSYSCWGAYDADSESSTAPTTADQYSTDKRTATITVTS